MMEKEREEQIHARMSLIENDLLDKNSQLKEMRRDFHALYREVYRRAYEELEDEFPDWRDIVGVPAVHGEPIDGSLPFRKWLCTKSAAYQTRIESANSAELIVEAIRLFHNEQGSAQ